MHGDHVSSAGSAAAEAIVDRTYARELLEQAHLDAVVATSPEHVFLLGGYGTWLQRRLRGWMVRPDGDSSPLAGYAVLSSLEEALVVSPLLRHEAMRKSAAMVWPRDGRGLLGPEDGADALVSLIEEMSLSDGRLGVELDGAPAWLGDRLKAALPRAVVQDCSVLLRLCRLRKSAEALRRVRQVASVTEESLDAMLAAGPSPAPPEARFRELLAHRGADFDHLVFGVPGGGVATAYTRPGAHGHCVYLDAGAQLDGFASDTGLTLRGAGAEARAPRRRFDRALEAFHAGAAALRAGTASSAVSRAMEDVAKSDRGLRAQGHGIGIDIRELPIIGGRTFGVLRDATITLGANLVLEIGMVVNLEVSGFYEDETLQIEATFVITSEGATPLVDQRRAVPWSDPWNAALDPGEHRRDFT